MPTRRKFIQAGLTTASVMWVGCAETDSTPGDTGAQTPTRPPEPETWSPDEPINDVDFPHGVMVGDVTENGGVFMVRTTTQAATVRVVVQDGDTWNEVSSTSLKTEEDGNLWLIQTGLDADTAYCVAAFTNAGSRSTVTRFRTAMAPDGWRVVRFGATSCFGGNRPWTSLQAAAEEKYDFFCMLGDLVYADNANSYDAYMAYYRSQLTEPNLRLLTASTSLIATWDDHELVNNFNWDTATNPENRVEMALSAFRASVPLLQGPGGTGIWRKLSWGATLDVFVLDCRGERYSDQYISPEQMDWLLDGLANSNARFKIILTSVAITDYTDLLSTAQQTDRWQGYPKQRQQVLTFIEDEGIDGILWIGGDFHYASVCRVGRPGDIGDNMYEVLAGPTGSFLNPLGDLIVNTDQYLLSHSEWNHTRFECDPDLGTVTVAFIGNDQEIFAEMVLDV